MNIYGIYRKVQPYFRSKRWQHFLKLFHLTEHTHILDVGGMPHGWQQFVPIPVKVDILNFEPWPEEWEFPERLAFVKGDGRKLQYQDAQFDIAYSNSVIEHVGSFEDQRNFAEEIRRVGKGVYVQTPNFWFPIEPHFIAFFIHWLPLRLRKVLIPLFSYRGWFHKGDPSNMQKTIDEVRLLTFREMKILFPDCEIYREKILGLTKSFTAYRRMPE